MKIVKGDTVYLRSGRDVANHSSRLHEALGIDDDAKFAETRERMPMTEQVERANRVHGVRGRVIRIMPKEGKLIVDGLNMVTKHQRPRSQGGAAQVQGGGRIKMPAPLPVSRVMLVCSNCDKPTRVSLRARLDTRATLTGEKQKLVHDRICKHCGEIIPRPTDNVGM